MKRILILNCLAMAAAFCISTATSAAPLQTKNVIPLIEMEEVLLTDAIRNLASMARLNILLDPRLSAPPFDRVTVSLRWQDITAREALEALLDNHDLVLVDSPRSSTSRAPQKHSPPT